MRSIKSLYLLPFLFCINCGTADSTTDSVPTTDVASAGGEAGNAGVGEMAGNVNVAGQGGRCHHAHHRCNLETHECY